MNLLFIFYSHYINLWLIFYSSFINLLFICYSHVIHRVIPRLQKHSFCFCCLWIMEYQQKKTRFFSSITPIKCILIIPITLRPGWGKKGVNCRDYRKVIHRFIHRLPEKALWFFLIYKVGKQVTIFRPCVEVDGGCSPSQHKDNHQHKEVSKWNPNNIHSLLVSVHPAMAIPS